MTRGRDRLAVWRHRLLTGCSAYPTVHDYRHLSRFGELLPLGAYPFIEADTFDVEPPLGFAEVPRLKRPTYFARLTSRLQVLRDDASELINRLTAFHVLGHVTRTLRCNTHLG